MVKKECPLCNGKTFKKGDDFEILCLEHKEKVVSVLTVSMCGEMWGLGKEKA